MFKFGYILHVFFIHILCVVKAQDKTILLNLSIATETEAAVALAEIQPHNVLPLVLFQRRKLISVWKLLRNVKTLELPKDVEHAVIMNRRMVEGTKFSNNSTTQMFFCPMQNSEEKCLIQQKFTELQPLECAKEPILVKHPESEPENICDQTGKLYSFGYDICPIHPLEENKTKDISLYGFCYNAAKKKTIFAMYIIESPKLLKSTLLFRERNVKYTVPVDEEFELSHLDNKIDFSSAQDLDSFVHPEKPSYKLQMLVPEANMAMALWRKTTYRNVNLEWQHEKLIPLWNKINDRVRSHAAELYEDDIEILCRTGVIEINPPSENNAQIINIWVTVFATTPLNDVIEHPSGTVILMNNFIRTATTVDDSSTISIETENAIMDFCQQDFCADTLQKEFDAVGGRVRCCSLDNVKVQELFDLSEDGESEELPVFRIPGVISNVEN